MVREHGLQSLESILASDKRLKGKRVVKALFCEGEGGYEYRLVVQSAAGALRKISVSAAK